MCDKPEYFPFGVVDYYWRIPEMEVDVAFVPIKRSVMGAHCVLYLNDTHSRIMSIENAVKIMERIPVAHWPNIVISPVAIGGMLLFHRLATMVYQPNIIWEPGCSLLCVRSIIFDTAEYRPEPFVGERKIINA